LSSLTGASGESGAPDIIIRAGREEELPAQCAPGGS